MQEWNSDGAQVSGRLDGWMNSLPPQPSEDATAPASQARLQDPMAWTESFQASPAVFFPLYQAGEQEIAPVCVTGTLRFPVRIAVGGEAIRIRLSNEIGEQPLIIKAATVARGNGGEAATGTPAPLTFQGQQSIVVPPGAPVISDPLAFATDDLQHLLVSVVIEHERTFDGLPNMSFWAAPGDQSLAPELQGARVVYGRPLVTGVEVATGSLTSVIVALGDSITDGARSRPDAPGWPEVLARRLVSLPPARRKSVVNAGIAGNRLLSGNWGHNALARLDRDVLRIANVSHVVVLEGINDIGMSGKTVFGEAPPVAAQELIAAYRQIIARCHARGIKVIGATLLPAAGSIYFSAEKEMVRQEANQWIRNSGEFDGIIDFEAVMQSESGQLRPEFDSGDYLHPNAAGYVAMGEAIDLAVFD